MSDKLRSERREGARDALDSISRFGVNIAVRFPESSRLSISFSVFSLVRAQTRTPRMVLSVFLLPIANSFFA